MYDKLGNQNFQNKLEKVWYKAFLAITGAIQGTYRQRLWDELGLTTLSKTRWYNKQIFLYKIVNKLLSNYPQYYIELPSQDNYLLRSISAGKLKSHSFSIKNF